MEVVTDLLDGRDATVPGDMADLLDLDSLLAQLITALGLALVFGNGFAMYKHARGEAPEGFEGRYRPGRARFLLIVGVIISIWGLLSLSG